MAFSAAMLQAPARRTRLAVAGLGATCSPAGMPSSEFSPPKTPNIAARCEMRLRPPRAGQTLAAPQSTARQSGTGHSSRM
jgi:hypothetical protein